MIRLIATAAALSACTPAHAEEAQFWMGTGCEIVLVLDAAHLAEIRCTNQRTLGLSTEYGRLEVGGVGVDFSVDSTPEPTIGQSPDLFAFEPDPGFYVEPYEMLIDEFGTGVALVYEWTGS